MAASAAFAPFLKKSKPIEEANGWLDATHPWRQTTGDRRDAKGSFSTPAELVAFLEAANQSPIVLLWGLAR